MTTLAAARVITPDRVLEPGVVEIDRGRIVTVAPTSGPVPPRTLAPGFVDLQVNGVDDVDVAHARDSDWTRLDALLLAQGVTTWVPTLVTAPLDSFAAPLARIAEAAARRGARPAIAGAHLEGPFLGEMHGAHPSDLVRALDLEWLAALPETVALVTLGPEQVRAVDAIRLLRERDVLVALGHSAATFEEAEAAVDAGARLVTHCFNGMPSLHHRTPGLLGAALSDVPPDRVAGAIFLTDGRVHDVPADAAALGRMASRHGRRDRRALRRPCPAPGRRHAGRERAHDGPGRAQRRQRGPRATARCRPRRGDNAGRPPRSL